MKNLKTFYQFVNEKTLSYKPEIGLGKKVKNIKEIIDGGVYWIAVPDENGTWYEVVSHQRSYQRKGEWFFNDMGGGSSLSFKDAELKREIGKGNVYHKK